MWPRFSYRGLVVQDATTQKGSDISPSPNYCNTASAARSRGRGKDPRPHSETSAAHTVV